MGMTLPPFELTYRDLNQPLQRQTGCRAATRGDPQPFECLVGLPSVVTLIEEIDAIQVFTARSPSRRIDWSDRVWRKMSVGVTAWIARRVRRLAGEVAVRGERLRRVAHRSGV